MVLETIRVGCNGDVFGVMSLSQPSGAGGEDKDHGHYLHNLRMTNKVMMIPLGVVVLLMLSIFYPNPPGPGGGEGRNTDTHEPKQGYR